ncbi:hypothetical protein DSO57_1023430 [Entomophthora muscae]|uniref:Uncharacterized protein n=1 Tax=Entomophthora muscae TaxID=34485 RepID=A0ACC2UCI8_9FUNG|nr:hypothetical protein DSO57_1023430 [Entomophthora muscae]
MLTWFIWKEVFSYLEHSQQLELRCVSREWNARLEEMIECRYEYCSMDHLKHIARFVRQGVVTDDTSKAQLNQCPNLISVHVSISHKDNLAEVIQMMAKMPKLRHLTVFESRSILHATPKAWLSFTNLLSLNLVLLGLGHQEQLTYLSGINCPNIRSLNIHSIKPSHAMHGLLLKLFPRLISVKLNYETNHFISDLILIPAISSLRDATITVNSEYPRHLLPRPELIPHLTLLTYTATRGPLEFLHAPSQTWPQITQLTLATPAYRLGPICQIFPNCRTLLLRSNETKPRYLNQLHGIQTLSLYLFPFSIPTTTSRLPSITCLSITQPFLEWALTCLPNLSFLDLSLGYGPDAEHAFYASSLPIPSLIHFFSPECRTTAFYHSLIKRSPNLASIFSDLPKEQATLLQSQYPHITFHPYIRLIPCLTIQ